jgi:hypothetical protein
MGKAMTPEVALILTTGLYKLSCLAVGCLFCILGYRLFKMGTWGNAGDMEAKFKDLRLVSRSGAPGTFFSVLGAAIVIATVWQGMTFNWESQKGGSPAATATPPPLPEVKEGQR